MQRFAFEIQYHGGNYFGWQRQPKQISVQEVIEITLNKLFNRRDCQVLGCGRTDTGVHAQQFFLHTDLKSQFSSAELHYKLNRILPKDISITSVYEVDQEFHARFDAQKRTYRYYIHTQKNPFKKDLSLYFTPELNLNKMNSACIFLLGKKDFTSFSKVHTDVKTNICEVTKAEWIRESPTEIFFEISADRFLRNMVRAIVGSLIEVGIGKSAPSEIEQIIKKRNRSEAKYSVPAQGLYLWSVEYDKTQFRS